MRCVNSPVTMAGKLPVAYQWISWLKLNHGKKPLCIFFASDGHLLVGGSNGKNRYVWLLGGNPQNNNAINKRHVSRSNSQNKRKSRRILKLFCGNIMIYLHQNRNNWFFTKKMPPFLFCFEGLRNKNGSSLVDDSAGILPACDWCIFDSGNINT